VPAEVEPGEVAACPGPIGGIEGEVLMHCTSILILQQLLRIEPGLTFAAVKAYLTADPATTNQRIALDLGITATKTAAYRALTTGIPRKSTRRGSSSRSPCCRCVGPHRIRWMSCLHAFAGFRHSQPSSTAARLFITSARSGGPVFGRPAAPSSLA
jgi:hypothetical protein